MMLNRNQKLDIDQNKYIRISENVTQFKRPVVTKISIKIAKKCEINANT